MRVSVTNLLESLYAFETLTRAGNQACEGSDIVGEVETFCERRGVLLITKECYEKSTNLQNEMLEKLVESRDENEKMGKALLNLKKERDMYKAQAERCMECCIQRKSTEEEVFSSKE